jgi:hypothetical protein
MTGKGSTSTGGIWAERVSVGQTGLEDPSQIAARVVKELGMPLDQ